MLKPLSDCSAGDRKIVRLVSVAEKAVAKRLADLGIFPGSALSVFKNESGEMIVGVAESRVLLARQVTKKVMVS